MSSDSLTWVKPREAREHIERCIRAGVVPYTTSSPGIGKSAIVRQIAKDYNLMLIDHRLSTSAPEDLSGLPRFRADGRAEFSPFADLFPLEGDPLPKGYDGWLLHLDEFPHASKSVQAAAYKLILDRMTGQHKLHPKVAIACSGNLMSDRAMVNPISTAMMSRMAHIHMVADHEQWMEDVAIPQRYKPQIVAFLAANPNKLMDFDPNREDGTYCCNRTWEFTNNLIADFDGPVPNKMATLLRGVISPGVATEFVQFTQVFDRLISLSDVLADPEHCRLPTEPNLYWATVTSLAVQTTLENLSKVVKYVERLSMTHRIIYYRSVRQYLVGFDETDEWRDASINIGQYLYSDN